MKKIIGVILLLIGVITSCKKEKTYVYEVEPVTVQQPGSEKPNVKSTQEFISIAYADLFGKTITNGELVILDRIYGSFGDRKLMEDMIIRNAINSSSVDVPTNTEMRADVVKFVTDCYKKFYNRLPSEYESWFLVNLINGDTAVTPVMVYYSFLTSNEYRYY